MRSRVARTPARAVALLATALFASSACVASSDASVFSIDAPASVTMPAGVTFHVTVPDNFTQNVMVSVEDDGRFWYQTGCTPSDNACSVTLDQGWLSSSSTTRRYKIQAGDGSQIVSVTFNQPDWHVTVDGPSAVTMPGAATLTMSVTPKVWSPYSFALYDDTGSFTGVSCSTAEGTCSGQVGGGFPARRIKRRYVATLTSGDLNLTDPTVHEVTYTMPNFGLALSAPALVQSSHLVPIHVDHAYNGWSPYRIYVRNHDGDLVSSCGTDGDCDLSTWSGGSGWNDAFYAEIVDNGAVLARTSQVHVAAIDPDNDQSVDGVDVSQLAGLYATSTDVCNALVYFTQGTYRAETSTSDQLNACLGVEQTGGTSAAAIRAALATTVGFASGAILAWLQHYAWINYGDNPPWTPPINPPYDPPSSPAPPPAVTGEIDALTDSLIAHNATALAALTRAQVREAARRCLFRVGAASLSLKLCETRPIFMPGADYPEATDHRIDAIAGWPAWVQLTRKTGPRDPWYRGQSTCVNKPAGTDCDEYPYNRTYEGGNPGATKRPPSLRPVAPLDNQGEGSAWGRFLASCNVPDGGTFLVIPLPPALGIPTQEHVCNA